MYRIYIYIEFIDGLEDGKIFGHFFFIASIGSTVFKHVLNGMHLSGVVPFQGPLQFKYNL